MLSKSIEIIPNKLYWISDRIPPKNIPNAFYFNIDNELVYEPFYADFGPLNLGHTYRFVTELEKLLSDTNYSKHLIYHYTSTDTAKRANAAYLMGAYQVIMLRRSAEDAWRPFSRLDPPLAEFRDASYNPTSSKLSILDCLRGLEYGISLRWFDIKTFNLMDYEFYEKIENGDLNWIVPGKFVAFSSPSISSRDPEGIKTFTPEDYCPIFKRFGVGLVIRLNKKSYEADRFTKQGVKHMELFFIDGTTPPNDVLEKFLNEVEREKSAVAIHCKAGLGRTGTLIGMYSMKHYRFPAAAFIGWIRICRPGSILGPQHQYLLENQARMWALADGSPIWKSIAPAMETITKDMDRLAISNVEYSPTDRNIAVAGDIGQGERLVDAKRKVVGSPLTSPGTKDSTPKKY